MIKIKIDIAVEEDKSFIGCGSFDNLNDAIDYLELIQRRLREAKGRDEI